MLNFALKGTYQDPSGYAWDYYADDQLDPNPDPNAFYIIPNPQFVLDSNGNPTFQLLTYATEGKQNGSGTLRFDVELAVPQPVEAAIAAQIKSEPAKFPHVSAPVFLTLAVSRASTASFTLTTLGVPTTYSASVSSFGGNVASFLVSLTKSQLDTVQASFSGSGGALAVTYDLSVPARLQGVSAVLAFDSSIAYQYQVTQPTYNEWGDQVSAGSVTKLLQESQSSTTTITFGVTNPPKGLKDDVTKWANTTLANLVTAEVQKVIQLQGLNSDNSFNISEADSFTSTFAENMVIDWLISPTATLPTFPDMKLDLSKFTVSVNEQQQQMIVSTNLPFFADSRNSPNLPKPTLSGTANANGVVQEAYVESVAVTVAYPGLPEADATYTFTKNEGHSFRANFDPTQGPSWNLSYEVNYQDTSMPAVSGHITDISSGNYILKLEEAGILSVTFDASQAFAAVTDGSPVPTELDIDFSYVNAQEPAAHMLQQPFKIRSTDTPQQCTVTSLQSMPISTTYNYTVNYIFPNDIRFTAPTVKNQNSDTQTINAARVIHPVHIVSYISTADMNDNPVLDGVVNMWYAQPPTLPPGANPNLTQPTAAAPAVFDLAWDTRSSGAYAKAVFEGLLYGDQPLMYSAALTTAQGPITINAQPIANSQASISVTPTQQYFTLQISPEGIEWEGKLAAPYASVSVLVTMTIAQGTAPSDFGIGLQKQQVVTWNSGESGSKYLTVPIKAGNTVTYDVEVDYIYPGQTPSTVVNKSAALTDVLFNIPALPTKA